jgi:drug/metabolite transporter (DMT)-like permease
MSDTEKRGLLFCILAISALQGEPVNLKGVPFAIMFLIGVFMFLYGGNSKKEGPK